MAPFFKKHKDGGDKAAAKGKAPASPPPADATTPPVAATTTPPDDTTTTTTKRAPLLNDDDEQFLERLISHDDDDTDETRPPLPPRPKTPDLTWDSDSDSVQARDITTTAVAEPSKKPSRLSRLFHRKTTSTTLTVPPKVPPKEAEREWSDLTRMLAHIGITPSSTSTTPNASSPDAATTTTLAAPEEVSSLLQQFLLILKDIMRGVPTAVDDLIKLLEGKNDALNKGFEKLPGPMQKLVIQLPKKLTSTLAPEVLAAAAEAQGLSAKAGESDGEGGLARFLMPKNLADLVITPAIVKSMLKAIVNALKLRWPAFVGTSVLWSTAVVLLLFVLWYCYKRGKEERERLEREEKEKAEGGKKEGEGVKQEEGEEGKAGGAVVVVEPPAESPRS